MADNTNVHEAVTVLSNVIESLERRIEMIDHRYASLSRKRKAYLMEAVEALLPAISGQVLRNLRAAAPDFVTPAVLLTFETNKKFLGIFARSGYDHALSLLQTRLSSYLDQVKYGDLQSIGAEMAQFVSEMAVLNAKSKDTIEVLKMLQQAAKKDMPLPAELTGELDRMVSASRIGRERQGVRPSSGFSPSRFASNSPSTTSSQNDTDLWFYMLTEIPISIRTMLWSAIHDHERHVSEPSFVTRGQDGDAGGVTSGSWQNDGYRSNDNQSSPSLNSSEHVAIITESVSIAADDSLGRFS